MERYIEQLIEDIREARTRVKAPSKVWDGVDLENDGEIEDLSYVEEFVYGEGKPLGEITGINSENLPMAHLLNNEQAAKLSVELEALLAHHNFIADFPSTLPYDERYFFLWQIWDDIFVELSFGENHIEFCDYNDKTCPFPDHCKTCKEVAAQMKYDEDKEKKNGSDDQFNLPPDF